MNSHHVTPSGKTRARALKLPFAGGPGENNAITDVMGVEIGVTTLITGEGRLAVGQGPVRTGVTAILPRGRDGLQIPCAAGSYALNGNGEMTGTIWIEECGELQTPITITNTNSCGIARDTTSQWLFGKAGNVQDWGLPVAAETYDGDLNDINGFHVKAEHVIQALDGARGGAVEQGSVGGGTGMICYDFKGGNGTASRVVKVAGRSYTVGALVQSNFGRRPECMMLGVPVGQHLAGGELRGKPAGSIIVIIATDAPLEAHQLKRLARRVPIGLARTGGIGHNSSGDIFLAFSTANAEAFAAKRGQLRHMEAVGTSDIDPLFEATIEATEEAIIDSMIANQTMVGRDGNTSIALPHDRLIDIMKKYGRM
ncbi:MAG TPA: P1 family peptidase [Nordella sp.]|nr:P1 family peptidase [Nordella sp.]